MEEGEGCAWTKKRVVRKRRAGLTAEGAEQAPEHVIEGMVGCKKNKRYIYTHTQYNFIVSVYI